ncbi:hypothetical protein BD770DRAFT_416352 [Pilaira anomala]|nr:hypothetical protein BD770DRAFT_416352 [Pilaira anomala]
MGSCCSSGGGSPAGSVCSCSSLTSGAKIEITMFNSLLQRSIFDKFSYTEFIRQFSVFCPVISKDYENKTHPSVHNLSAPKLHQKCSIKLIQMHSIKFNINSVP